MENYHENTHSNSIKVAITHGDFNGISYEIIIKAFHHPEMLDLCTPVVYGSSKLASYYKNALNDQTGHFNLIKTAHEAVNKRVNIINVFHHEVKVDMGKSSTEAGKQALAALERATQDIINGEIDVLVTAPINKDNIQSSEFHFPGHTEYLAERFGANSPLMLMVSQNLRVGVATGHIPISQVSKLITKDLIAGKLNSMIDSMVKDFNIPKPRIAVLGLNPHASDNGLIGDEEEKIIIPTIKSFKDKGALVYGPFSADGFFADMKYLQFDAILAMYHDQGLIPFKTLAFEEGVNFTAGLPYVRTSPAHGTAYDITGKNIAKPNSMLAAIYLAIDVYRNRMQFKEANANPLPLPSGIDKGKDENINPFADEEISYLD
ncbi:MAG: 4-hydroxythreonine-4-phosphate dehydrogenase PdxA [Bacteroidales bacterium]|nr:4-hydroxythreonine-4-phosphate dehydrogenase PdxA [Bacteroidales bacterium]